MAESDCSRSHSGQARTAARFIRFFGYLRGGSYHYRVKDPEGVPGVPPPLELAPPRPPAASSPTLPSFLITTFGRGFGFSSGFLSAFLSGCAWARSTVSTPRRRSTQGSTTSAITLPCG